MKFKQDEYQFIQQLQNITNYPCKYQVLENIHYRGIDYPIYSFEIGPEHQDTPVIGLFGGVHGLEKVGTHVVLSYLNYVLEQLNWNSTIQALFEQVRLVSIPLINPIGFFHQKRSNGNDIDLMRNAPIESSEKVAFLVGGHRYSHKLPWYRGTELQLETKTLIQFVEAKILPAPFAQSIDFHSGFGFKDRLWYPYAASKKKFPDTESVEALSKLFKQTHPHHIYTIEPQSIQYTTHGDIWDFLYHKTETKSSTFLPWTLEMGSWSWLKKNPLQLTSPLGLFNPLKQHRFNRVMRRHLGMIDFFVHSTLDYKKWS